MISPHPPCWAPPQLAGWLCQLGTCQHWCRQGGHPCLQDASNQTRVQRRNSRAIPARGVPKVVTKDGRGVRRGTPSGEQLFTLPCGKGRQRQLGPPVGAQVHLPHVVQPALEACRQVETIGSTAPRAHTADGQMGREGRREQESKDAESWQQQAASGGSAPVCPPNSRNWSAAPPSGEYWVEAKRKRGRGERPRMGSCTQVRACRSNSQRSPMGRDAS